MQLSKISGTINEENSNLAFLHRNPGHPEDVCSLHDVFFEQKIRSRCGTLKVTGVVIHAA